jgi:hypothetical protein
MEHRGGDRVTDSFNENQGMNCAFYASFSGSCTSFRIRTAFCAPKTLPFALTPGKVSAHFVFTKE